MSNVTATITATASCPECDAELKLVGIQQNDIVTCDDCGQDLEVTLLDPLTLELAPQEQEDWGE
jgi:alpha-aminoadipate carrier protein LysW